MKLPPLPSALLSALSPNPIGVTLVAVAMPPLVLVAPRIVTRTLSVSACGLAGAGKVLAISRLKLVGDHAGISLTIGRVDIVELGVRALINGGRIDDHRPVFREHRRRLRIGPGFGAGLVLGHHACGRQRNRRMVLRLRDRRRCHQQDQKREAPGGAISGRFQSCARSATSGSVLSPGWRRTE